MRIGVGGGENVVHDLEDRFFVFLETAEHEFLESLGTPVIHQREGHLVGWPRVSAALEYQSPARLGDELTIQLSVARKGTTSLTYDSTGVVNAAGFFTYCDARGATEARAVLINNTGRPSLSTDSNGDGTHDDATGTNLVCP